MQSNFVNAMQLTRTLMDFSMPKASQKHDDGNDSFLNILSERMDSRKNNGFEQNSWKKTDFVSKDKAKFMTTGKRSSADNDFSKTDKLQNRVSDNTNTTKSESVKDSKTVKTSEADKAQKAEDMTKAEKEEKIRNLEAMIALLEQLLAQLEVKVVDQIVPVFPQKTLMPVEEEGVSPMEILKMLVSQNIKKLEEFLGKMQQDEKSPEVIALMDKITDILKKLNGEFSGESDATDETSKKIGDDLIQQMKAGVSNLIEDLKSQVSELRDSLALEAETDLDLNMEIQESSMVSDDLFETDAVDSGQDVEADNSEGDSRAEDQGSKTDSLGYDKLDANLKGPEQNKYENFIIPDNQITKESVQEAAKVFKSNIPLSQKPLEQTVTNQVMMKVKLMAGENKQELEMHLKPESLGKLSLKIIHERGEVLAKITAENQQVKEIIENNMQMLKDALENSGLTVQNLSVSIGNNNESRNESEGENAGRQYKGIARSNNIGPVMADKSEIRAKIENEYSASQIDLTA